MKIIVAGSRDLWPKYGWIVRALDDWSAIPRNWCETAELVSGGAAGVDTIGERLSREYLKREPKVFPADWDTYGKAAGHLRNEQMARYADAALVLLKKVPSPGSSNMATWMLLLKKPVKVLAF